MSSSVNHQNESIVHLCLLFKGKIKDMFPPGSINCTTTLALVNAIHFKGQWAVKFKEENTRKMPFRLNKVQLEQELLGAGESRESPGNLCSAVCRASLCPAQVWGQVCPSQEPSPREMGKQHPLPKCLCDRGHVKASFVTSLERLSCRGDFAEDTLAFPGDYSGNWQHPLGKS